MSKERVKKAWVFLIDATCFIYMAFALGSIVYGIVTSGIVGFIGAVVISVAAAFTAFIALVLVSFILIAIWGRDVLGK